jgi:type II secretory pathway component GspD/PulD (secretin)
MRATPEELALAQKVINDLDRPKKAYRLTYTITDIDGGKRIGVQHFSTIVTEGQRSLVKQVSKVPVVTGSYNNTSSQTESQVTYLDVGLIFDSMLASYGGGASLRSKVERSSVAEERSGVGPQDPVVRSTSVEGTSFLTAGKPVVLGSLDIPGSARHLDVDVMIEPIGQ